MKNSNLYREDMLCETVEKIPFSFLSFWAEVMRNLEYRGSSTAHTKQIVSNIFDKWKLFMGSKDNINP